MDVSVVNVNETQRVSSIGVGATFEVRGNYYMRTTNVAGDGISVVDLESGRLLKLDDGVAVSPIKLMVVLKDD